MRLKSSAGAHHCARERDIEQKPSHVVAAIQRVAIVCDKGSPRPAPGRVVMVSGAVVITTGRILSVLPPCPDR